MKESDVIVMSMMPHGCRAVFVRQFCAIYLNLPRHDLIGRMQMLWNAGMFILESIGLKLQDLSVRVEFFYLFIPGKADRERCNIF